jgi:parallel beta-helix repeat protein
MDVYQMTTKSEGMMMPGKLKWYAILALALWLAFSGVAAAEQLYVNESGWWRVDGAFNVSTTPIQAAVDAAGEGDSIFVWNGSYNERVVINKVNLTLQGEDKYGVIIDAMWSGNVVEITSSRCVVQDVTVTRSATCGDGVNGIYIRGEDNCVKNIISTNNHYGIRLSYSNNNRLTGNVANNAYMGIELGHSSNNMIESNIISDNSGEGIATDSSNNNTIANNTVTNNGASGINLGWYSSNNIIAGNTANGNDGGMFLSVCSNHNTITSNDFCSNDHYGIFLTGSSNNEIYHNNFIGNDKPAHDHNGFNKWDNGSTIGGNYWSDHVCHGNPSDGSEPYTGIDTNAGAVDNYPFEESNGWAIKNQLPIANFTYIPLNPIVNQMVTFNASNSADSDGTITNYEWDFGDGNTTNTTEETITHFYTSAEDYTVNLTVADDESATNSTSKAITVYPPTIIYVPDDYAKIQWAVDNASAGDTIFVWNGSYNENVNVNKQLTLEGEGADVVTVTAASPDDHVFEVTKDYTSISGFAVRGATDYNMAGVYLDNVDHCNISRNSVYGNYRGIYLHSSSNNTLTNNNANSNSNGICLFSSSYNTLTNNTANSNSDGIYLLHSSNYNALTSNNASNNDYGILLVDSSNNTLTDNTANSNNWGDGICLRSSSNNELTGNTANSNNDYGIYLDYSSNYNTLTNNTANSNSDGIYLYDSSNNTLTNNTANSNNYDGIYLYSSSNNTLTDNTANSNNWGDGIYLRYSSNNELTGNTANSNNDYGIYLYNADDNNIACNLVQNNTERGFYLTGGSTGNNISYNNIIENGNYNAASGGWEWQFDIEQYQPVEAKHNYWGAGMNNSTIDASIYDNEEGEWGEVEFYPFETEPAPCAPTPEEPHTFTTADAVIALQIAAGSRQPDLRWDVSGEGSVTSLDALMILQAAAGSIEIG